MDYGIYAGDTSKTIYFRLRDSTTGLAKTGLVFNSTGASCYFTLPLAVDVQIPLVTLAAPTTAWASGGFVEVDATTSKGLYRLDLSDAAIASGSFTAVSIEFDGVIEETQIIPLHTREVDVTKWLGTAAATPTVAGVPEVDVTYVDGSAVTGGTPDVNVTKVSGTTQTAGDLAALAATAQADLDIITGASGVNLLTATQASIDAIETDTSTTIPATISTAQADLDIITGASGVNLLTATQASIDAIETDTSTTIPATISTAQADLDIITGASGVNLLTATQASIDAIEVDTGTTLPALIGTPSADLATDIAANQTDLNTIISTGSTGPWTSGGAASSATLRGVVTRAGSTYYVSFVLIVSGAMVTTGLSSLVTTFYDEDGTDMTFSGSPSESGGFIYATGTLGTALVENRPLVVKIGATYGGTAYSNVLPGVAVA